MNQRLVENKKGITMIALVISIIVIIVLAGISLNLVLNENGIMVRAKEQKILQAKAEILQELEMAKGPEIVDGKGYIALEKYLDYIDKNGINSHTVTNIIKNTDGINSEITIDGEYVYTAAQIGNDVIINAVGHIDELDPVIESFKVIENGSNYIKVEVQARRADEY